jgi:molecular chaperone GrpE
MEMDEEKNPEVVSEEVTETPAPSSPSGKIVLSAAEYEKLVREAAEYKDKYVRLLAEFDNARKRAERERTEFLKYANEGLITDFLGIMDDLGRVAAAAQAKHQDDPAFSKGVEMVMARIHELLRKNNVKPIDEAVGKPFDPHCHEILMQEPSDKEEGTIIEELQKGYWLGDRVVRTSKVKVAIKQ